MHPLRITVYVAVTGAPTEGSGREDFGRLWGLTSPKMNAKAGGVAPLATAATDAMARAAASHPSMWLYSDSSGACGGGALGGLGADAAGGRPRRLPDARPSAVADRGAVSPDSAGIAAVAGVRRARYVCMSRDHRMCCA